MTTILFRIVRICLSQFKCNYLKNKKPSGNFPFNFCDPHQILNILKKNLIVHANVFPKLQTVKDLVRSLSKKCRFRTSFDNQDITGSQTLVKFPRAHVYHIFHLSAGNSFGKYRPYCYVKSYRCLLTHWLPMTIILFKIVRISHFWFKCNYLKNEKIFGNFLFHF